jgi:hypothetical protein
MATEEQDNQVAVLNERLANLEEVMYEMQLGLNVALDEIDALAKPELIEIRAMIQDLIDMYDARYQEETWTETDETEDDK